jgi:hypothetical protein
MILWHLGDIIFVWVFLSEISTLISLCAGVPWQITWHFFMRHSWPRWFKGFNSSYCCSSLHVHVCWNEGKFWTTHGLQDFSQVVVVRNLLQHLWPYLSGSSSDTGSRSCFYLPKKCADWESEYYPYWPILKLRLFTIQSLKLLSYHTEKVMHWTFSKD